MKKSQITIERGTLCGALKGALLCSSNDDTRPSICTVAIAIDKKSRTLKIMATDGHTLVRLSALCLETSTTQDATAVIEAADAERLAAALKHTKRTGVLPASLTVSQEGIQIEVDKRSTSVPVKADNFPQWEQVIPAMAEKETGAATSIQLNPDYIMRVQKVLKAFAGYDYDAVCARGVSIQLGESSLVAARFDAAIHTRGDSVTVVVMPMRAPKESKSKSKRRAA